MQGELYPEYYQNFHFQTDGWMSSTSAEVYDLQTEMLFVGKQDSMQKLTLIPMTKYLKTNAIAKPVIS